MAVNFDDFWGRIGSNTSGLLDAGMGIYGATQGPKEASRRLRTAQGPVYDASMAGAQTALGQAGSMDPQAFAQQRLNQQHALLAGKDTADEDALMRRLHATGMLGAASFNPGVEGITPNGTAMNPQLAAFYAARGGRDARMANDAFDQGQKQIDTYVNRAGMLQRNAANTQAAGITAQGQLPSKTKSNMGIIKGLGQVAKDTGLLGAAGSWLKNFTAPAADPYAFYSGGQGLDDVLAGFGGGGDDWWSSVF